MSRRNNVKTDSSRRNNMKTDLSRRNNVKINLSHRLDAAILPCRIPPCGKAGTLAKAEFLNLQSNGLLHGLQLLFSLEPMFLVMARLLSLREPDFIGLCADFRLGWGRLGLLWRVVHKGESSRSLSWFCDYRFAGTGGRIFSSVDYHNDVLSVLPSSVPDR